MSKSVRDELILTQAAINHDTIKLEGHLIDGEASTLQSKQACGIEGHLIEGEASTLQSKQACGDWSAGTEAAPPWRGNHSLL